MANDSGFTIDGHAAVIGAGTMGADIALLFAAGGWQVHVVEPSNNARKALPERFTRGLERMGAATGLKYLRTHASLDDVPWKDVGIVVECVPEKLETKRAVFAQVE